MSDWLTQLKNPPAAYRPAPFWAWNSKLEKAELIRQVGEFARAGMGGFFMHVRYGLETDYLSAEFMDCIKAVVALAKKRKMEAWLYDEDRWPSGFAGGMVTRHPEYRIKALQYDEIPAEQFTAPPADAIRCFAAKLDGDSASDVRPLADGEKAAPGRSVLVYRVVSRDGVAWFNNTNYVDVMNPDAIKAFIDCTHEAYKKVVGEEFGKTIPGIFTDEPNYGSFHPGSGVEAARCLPWTGRFADEFRTRKGYDILDRLVEVSHRVDGAAVSPARRDFFQVATELYVEAFSKQLGEWCGKNNLELTGHELSEESLRGQVSQVGAAMPHYEHFQRPGIDILMDREPEVLTIKQCVSVATQLGRNRVLSELYGCTGWDATFEMYKHIGDWHQVLGVNSLCPHLSWYSMAGGAKRDYPAGIFYQSPWWADHKLLADYFGRLSLALSQGRPVREVVVVHPIETAWAAYQRTDPAVVESFSQSLERLCTTLLDRQFDFDFADESLMAKYASIAPQSEKSEKSDGNAPRFRVGQAAYRVVIVPESLTLRTSTVELLERFADAGGSVVFVGCAPTLLDGQPSDRVALLVRRSTCAPHSGAGLVAAVGEEARPVRVDIARRNEQVTTVWTHLRQTEQGEVLFLHHRDRVAGHQVKVAWAGAAGCIREIDLATGKIVDLAGVEVVSGRQVFRVSLPPTGSRLYLRTAEPAKSTKSVKLEPAVVRQTVLAPVWDYSLDEPNAINLDYCRVRVAGVDRDWRPRKLVWQHERDIRKQAGFRDNATPGEQPYVWLKNLSPKAVPAEVEFEINVDQPPTGPVSLALEHPERFEIRVNGKTVKSAGEPEAPLSQGCSQVDWFIDRSFRIVPLKSQGVKLRRGVNTICLRTEYREHHWLEEVYLIGRFGARVCGDRAVITALPTKLAVGDWCDQGLAMYSGAVTYRQAIRVPKLAKGERAILSLSSPKATVVRVTVNGRHVRTVGWQPWEVDVTDALKAGPNRIEITLVSSRRNLLGPLHYAPKNPRWTGPGEFRSEPGSANFAAGYNLVPYGLLGQVKLVVKK